MIHVFEDVEATQVSIEQVFARHVPVGMPIEQARELLQAEGLIFTPVDGGWLPFSHFPPHSDLLSPSALRRALVTRSERKMYYHTTRQAARKEEGEWPLTAVHLCVVLIQDEAGRAVQSVDVGLRVEQHPHSPFFRKHPEMRSPAGLPLSAAEARMTSYGFHCSSSSDEDPPQSMGEKVSCPRLSCRYYDDGALGGEIIRVLLVADESGVVRKVEVGDWRWFDAERCMWPHDGDSTGWAVCKLPLYPVRLGCRYALLTLAIGLGGAGGGHGRSFGK
jgi:hypothetical protein